MRGKRSSKKGRGAMKKNLSVLFSVLVSLVVLFSNVAVAKAPPKPPADCGKDADHDGWCVADPDRGNKLVGEKDCNDVDPKVNPGATEVLDDGIDQDCVDGDLKAQANIKAWGCSSAKCVQRVQDEIAACNAVADKCTVNHSSGRFVLAWGAYMVDSDCDGVREVLDQAGKDAYDLKVKQGFHCVSERRSSGAKKSGSGKPGSGGASGKPAVAPKSDPKVGELEGKVGELDSSVKILGGQVSGLVDQFDGFDADLDALDNALKGEAAMRVTADQVLSGQISELSGKHDTLDSKVNNIDSDLDSTYVLAKDASESAEAAHSTGVSAGLDVGVMVIGQSDIKLKGGQQARPGVAPTLLVGGHVGAETESGLYRALGAVGVPYETAPEGNTENGFLVTLGAEALFKVSSRGSAHSIGPVVRFIQHESGGDVLGVNAMSRGGSAGVAYELAPAWGRFRTPVHASLEAGYEQLGTKGKNFTAIGNAPMALLTVTFGAGVGSANR